MAVRVGRDIPHLTVRYCDREFYSVMKNIHVQYWVYDRQYDSGHSTLCCLRIWSCLLSTLKDKVFSWDFVQLVSLKVSSS